MSSPIASAAPMTSHAQNRNRGESALDKVRYAIVGAGWIAQEAFMPAVDQTGNSVMTAIITGNAETAAKLKAFYGIAHHWDYDAYDAALASGEFDAVYIALPNSMHADFAIRALRAGLHAIVEKPLAISVAECEAMIAASDASGAHLMTAYRLHCEPATVEAIRLVREGAIGSPRYFSSCFSFLSNAGNHRLEAKHWGGPLQDIGVYCLNAARHVIGAEPIEAVAMQHHGDDPKFAEVEATIAALLRFPGGEIAHFTVSFDSDATNSYRIIGTTGEIEMQRAYEFQTSPRLVLRKGGTEQVMEFDDVDHFGAQTAYFSDCIRTGKRPMPDGAEGLADVRALLAIEAASRTGQAQKIEGPAMVASPEPSMVRNVPRTDRRLVL